MHQVIQEFSLVNAAVALLGEAIPTSVTVLELSSVVGAVRPSEEPHPTLLSVLVVTLVN